MGLTVVVVLVVLAVIAAIAILAVQGRRRRQEQQRIEAAEHRHEAEIRTASAQRREAEAAERAARADHERAQAREQAARAGQDREVAQARQAAADRIDPDRSHRDDPADPAARTDDLRMPGADHDRPEQPAAPAAQGQQHDGGRGHAGPAAPGGQFAAPAAAMGQHRGGPEHPGSDGGQSGAAGGPTGQHAAQDGSAGQDRDAAGVRAGHRPGPGADRPWGHDGHDAATGPVEQPGAHATEPQPDVRGSAADPAARTDDLDVGRGGRHQASPGTGRQDDPLSQAWHGPSATGGSAAAGHRRREPDTAGRDDAPGEVPAQRTGEHERHGVRALADRLLGRHG